jgi:glycerol-3-phosphate cytidylyltransferase-like family protein
MKRIISFGTFDVFYVGHLMIIKGACGLGDYLKVGVST